jgi:two-component system, NtrC family, sensor kinase
MSQNPASPPPMPRRFQWLNGAADRSGAAIPQRPRRGLTWPLRGLLAASLAVPLLLLAIASWQNFRLVQRQAEERVTIEAGELDEHDLTAFKTFPLALAWIDERIRGQDWDHIEHDQELQRLLSNLETLPQIDAVWVVDAAGRVRASGRSFPAPIAPDDCVEKSFLAQKQHDSGILVGREDVDPLTRNPEFNISRRRSTPSGSFDGVIIVSAKARYFSDFYSTISAERGYEVFLVRTDGSILANYPEEPKPAFGPDSAFLKMIALGSESGVFRANSAPDGVERIYAFRHISGYPVDVEYGLPTGNVIPSWRANLANYLLFAVPASLALFGMTFLAVRQIQREKIASWRWHATARRLRREMDRRAQAEAELLQAQKIEALGQLTGGIAHDFNNLLAVLQGCLEMLNGRQADDRLQARVSLALQTVERGEKLTAQLLAFARRQPPSSARVEINLQLRRMTELLARTVGSGVTIETDLAADLWPVDVDPTQLELAVINLAINARDAMPDGGRLFIRTANTTVSGDTPGTQGGDFVDLEVSDNGTGMSPEVAARAFEPFFTTKKPGKGTGLGLSMIYGFAQQVGGTVAIRSEVGRGTTVALRLRRSPEQRAVENATGLPASGAA